MRGEVKMDDHSATGSNERVTDGSGPCTKPFLLCDLREGKKDKLGHEVEELLWIGRSYAIYRSQKGVYLQFSDCPQEEEFQRSRFTEISPELCELRYLTYEMRSRWNFGFGPRTGRHPSSLYDHNMAQALMLVMEDKVKDGKQLAQQALTMAVQRVTNDNTVRYLRSCLSCWVLVVIIGIPLLFLIPSQELRLFVVAAMCGATGAVLSVATRLQAFELKPCHQSNMNYWMSCTRLGIGLIAGPIILLLGPKILSESMRGLVPTMEATGVQWQGAAVLGLIGGFAERLIPNLLGRTADEMESPVGTPVQAVRSEAMQRDAARPQPTE
jgi:hypothetical protein